MNRNFDSKNKSKNSKKINKNSESNDSNKNIFNECIAKKTYNDRLSNIKDDRSQEITIFKTKTSDLNRKIIGELKSTLDNRVINKKKYDVEFNAF